MCEFEKKVLKGLIECGVDVPQAGSETSSNLPRIGVAVSGGADSISLLLALSKLFSSLYVITVNHNIRPAAESRGDVDFVLEVCGKLRREGREVVCDVAELERGEVERCAAERGGGIEEAARHLRYAAFEKFVASRGLSVLCLAHNQNDQLETILMRFLQGSPAEAAAGIRARRGYYVRPLLNISRQEIEAYVNSRGFSWCTDKTNLETDYLRNKLRLKLVPFLESEFPGWQKALLSGSQKAIEDADFIQSCIEQVPLDFIAPDCVEIPFEPFMSAHPAIKRRLILSACNAIGEKSRIPHQFLKDVLSSVQDINAKNGNLNFSKHFGCVNIVFEKNHLFVKKYTENNTDLVFSDIIEKTGSFEFPFGNLDVFNYREQDGKSFVSVCIEDGSVVDGISLPFCIRNISPGDTILSADGTEKKLSDILSDWHVSSSKRNLIPVIQLLDEKSQRIKAVLAGFLGYKDWIVKL